MSNSPIASSEQLRLLHERNIRMQDNMARPGPSQYPAPERFQGLPSDIEQQEQLSQQKRQSAQQKAALINAAAKLAHDASSLAEHATDVARQASEVAVRVVDLLGEDPPLFAPLNPHPVHQLDQPMANYQSQFPAAAAPAPAAPKRKRKPRASTKTTSATSNNLQPPAPLLATPLAPHVGRHDGRNLADYQTQLMLLEQANQKRRQLQDANSARSVALEGHDASEGFATNLPSVAAAAASSHLQGPAPVPRGIAPEEGPTAYRA